MTLHINVPSHAHICLICEDDWRCYNQTCYYEDGSSDKFKTCQECEQALKRRDDASDNVGQSDS